MSKRILQIVESAYRATVEEQDDTVIWFTHAIRGGGADVSVLLRGAAVNYAVRGQDASGLAFGDRKQTQPPDVAGDVVRLVAKGVDVFVAGDDLAARGLTPGDLVEGPTPVTAAQVAALIARHDLVWHW
jgi:intracellular sulfur oxidation DsrE/DsrF family protein